MGTGTDTLTATAREAVASACAQVRDGGDGDEVDGVRPGLVARPADTDQVAEVLRAAAAHGLTVVPRGRGTKLSWGTAPRSADVLLDVSGLDRVLEHAAGDLIVATQAGARLADVQQVVGEGGQWLALDETVPGASIGGTLAANTSGPRRVATGTARDLLIGVTVVRADGVVAKAGGKVVKNVAGYDLGKLVIGSAGTLAVVVDATFRLHPVAPARRWVTVAVDDAARAGALSQDVVHAQVVPSAVEVDWTPAGDGSVSVLLEGREDGVVARADAVRRLLGDAATVGTDAPAAGATYPWDLTATGDLRATALKLTFVLSGLTDVLAAAGAAGASVRGSAGAGVAYAALPSDRPAEEVAAAVDRLRAACASHGGTAVVVDAPAAVKAAVDVWGPVPALDLMRRVKDQFDPDHRLSPGRYVGGI
ncbi:FAD-binding oxidoreductase [Nocardioides sp. KIGAM211]|uniref:FAD-binding oxidoreductase n=1 Tax=Nocardioides luti TaxID=2761101 RepID=A0A7X0VAV5_9ACTN|nr:FAD-binding oxidoreductase [Nocardioides luti]MBB6627327.1 FAD-binding oxidoreductase [Nocardioides luti]